MDSKYVRRVVSYFNLLHWIRVLEGLKELDGKLVRRLQEYYTHAERLALKLGRQLEDDLEDLEGLLGLLLALLGSEQAKSVAGARLPWQPKERSRHHHRHEDERYEERV